MLGLGAEGLVGANAVNMSVRIVWCAVWVEGWWREQGQGENGGRGRWEVPRFKVLSKETCPKARTVSVGVAAWAVLAVLKRRYFDGGWKDFVAVGGVAGVVGLTM